MKRKLHVVYNTTTGTVINNPAPRKTADAILAAFGDGEHAIRTLAVPLPPNMIRFFDPIQNIVDPDRIADAFGLVEDGYSNTAHREVCAKVYGAADAYNAAAGVDTSGRIAHWLRKLAARVESAVLVLVLVGTLAMVIV